MEERIQNIKDTVNQSRRFNIWRIIIPQGETKTNEGEKLTKKKKKRFPRAKENHKLSEVK